jgi:hypothetical protein
MPADPHALPSHARKPTLSSVHPRRWMCVKFGNIDFNVEDSAPCLDAFRRYFSFESHPTDTPRYLKLKFDVASEPDADMRPLVNALETSAGSTTQYIIRLCGGGDKLRAKAHNTLRLLEESAGVAKMIGPIVVIGGGPAGHSPRNLISSEKKNDDESSGIVIKTLSESVLSLHGGLEPEFPKEFHFWVFFLFFSWTQIPSALAGIHTPLSRAIFNPGFQSMCLNRVIASHDMSPFGIPRYQQRQLG